MERSQPHYFGAGPALLPTSVLQKASEQLLNYNNQGIGIAEMSHRSADAIQIINDAKRKITQLLNVPDTHEVFFAQGGGTGGFAGVAYNLMAYIAQAQGRRATADYIVTGSWSQKAAEEAQRLGVDVHVVDARKSGNGKFGTIPEYTPSENVAYTYYCDNETVHGVEYNAPPHTIGELVADMSSNIMSKKLDVSQYGLIFGGAQKNIGIAGVSLYIIKKSLLEQAPDAKLKEMGIPLCPIFMHFPTIVKNNSAYNTVSIFAVQVVNLYMGYLLAKGGLEAQEAESNAKAEKLYKALDDYGYNVLVDAPARSRMNLVFQTNDDAAFLKGAEERGLTGLKGHRSVGGIRISNYNAVAPESVDLLVQYLKDYAS